MFDVLHQETWMFLPPVSLEGGLTNKKTNDIQRSGILFLHAFYRCIFPSCMVICDVNDNLLVN